MSKNVIYVQLYNGFTYNYTQLCQFNVYILQFRKLLQN